MTNEFTCSQCLKNFTVLPGNYLHAKRMEMVEGQEEYAYLCDKCMKNDLLINENKPEC